VATIPGGSWSGSCAGSVAGSSWHRIKSINGTSVSRLFGVSYVYAGSGLFSSSVPTAQITEGIDVSHWQGTIDWNKVWLAGKRFAFIKASQSDSIVDDMYVTNRSGAKSVGMKVGAYHFAAPSNTVACDLTCDARNEADHVVGTAQIASGELRPVLHLEQTGGLAVPDLQQWVKVYMARVYSRSGIRGVIYVSPAFWTKYMGDTDWFARNGYEVLWIAHWTTAPSPTMPATNWGTKGWTFWQYKVADAGTVPGITTRIDLDRFNGTDFRKVQIP
jgi:GH25 family lysozyme M1 (1,4-beta-N-acetylmuramidase)